MADREIQTDRLGAPPLAHQLAGDVVDGGDVVGVERVAQTQHVGEPAAPRSTGLPPNTTAAQTHASALLARRAANITAVRPGRRTP